MFYKSTQKFDFDLTWWEAKMKPELVAVLLENVDSFDIEEVEIIVFRHKWPNQSSVLLFKATDKFFYLPHTTMQTSQEQTFTKKVSSGVLSLYWALMGNTALSILKENRVQQWNFIL